MIKREAYMSRIRPFIGGELVKVITGIRRSGKSVMLELIKEELAASGVGDENVVSINFEDMRFGHLLTAQALHDEIAARVGRMNGKAYLFFDEIQEVAGWERCVNSFRVEFDCDIYITGSNAKLLSGELATYLGGRYVEFVIYPFSFSDLRSFISQFFPIRRLTSVFRSTCFSAGCRISAICATPKSRAVSILMTCSIPCS